MSARFLAVLGVVAALSAPSALACDSTTCLMLTRGTASLLGRGGFQLDLSFRYTDQSARRLGTDETDTVVRPKVFIEQQEIIPGYHEDRRGSESFFQVDLAWGAASRTTLFASMPLFGQRYYVIGHGGVETSYNVKGIGDLVLGARQALIRNPQHSLVASFGFQVPTGKNDEIDVYDSTILDPTMQPGTGAGELIAALQWSTVTPGKTELSLSGSYQLNTTNDYNYKFGNEVIGAATVSRPLGRFTPSLQLKVYERPRSEFAGQDAPSTGGTFVYLNAGLRLRSSECVGFYGFFLLPVYRDVHDAQLAPRLSVLIGISKVF